MMQGSGLPVPDVRARFRLGFRPLAKKCGRISDSRDGARSETLDESALGVVSDLGLTRIVPVDRSFDDRSPGRFNGVRFVGGKRQPWRRWWTPSGVEPPLSNGMLKDRTGSYGRWLAGGLVELDDRHDTRCLVLLGEPGSGKSDELDAERGRWEHLGVAVLHVDLGAQSDWAALRSSVFDVPKIATWRRGTAHLVMLLDGFDEAQATVSKLTEGLVAGLQALPLDRLYLRITGRPSVWPERLIEQLRLLWPNSFEALALAPLTAEDVRVAAHTALGDGDAFVRDVLARDVGVLAARPITLGMLLLAAREGLLPDDRGELYTRAVEALAVESHERRMQDRATGPPAVRRVEAAEVLATVTLLTGTPMIERRRGPITRPGVLPLDDAIGEGVTMEELDAVWDSALLTPSIGGTLTWTHRSVAEFLSARRLARLPVKTVRHLLSDAESGKRVVPQLAGVAVWAASMSEAIFDWVTASDPALLLTPDLRTASPQRRRRLAKALLSELAEDHPPGEFRHYNLLDYPELPHDLAPLLEPTQPTWVRREAIRFLADTNRREHDRLLMAIIEDVAARRGPHSYDDEVELADVAAYALNNATDPTVLDRAGAVAAATTAPAALRAELITVLWTHRDLESILAMLESGLLAHRRSPLARQVSDGLSTALRSGAADPTTIVEWLLRHPPNALHNDVFARVAGAAVLALLASGEIDDEAWSNLGHLAAGCAHSSNDVFDWRAEDTSVLRTDFRRRLALETLLASGHAADAFSLRASGLLPDEDFEYWRNVYADAVGTDAEREAAARNALFLLAKPTEANRAAERLGVERPEPRIWHWSDPEVLRQWQQHQESEGRRQAEQASRQANARFSLGRLETYIDAADWASVAHELTLPATDARSERHVAGLPLSSAPAWKAVDSQIRYRILDLAAAYLASLPDSGTSTTAANVGGAYALLSAVAPEQLVALDASAFLSWLPALFDSPGHHTTVGELLVAVGAVRPHEVEALVLEGIEEDANAQYAAHVARLGRYTTPAVEDALADAAGRDITHAWVLDEILPALLQRDKLRGTELALEIISRRPPTKPESGVIEDQGDPTLRLWQRAVSAAATLAGSEGIVEAFESLLAELTKSPEFAAAVIRRTEGRPSGSSWVALTADQLATLYLWAKATLPEPTRAPPGVTVGVDSVREFADEVFRRLRARTDPQTAVAFDRIATENDDPWARTAAADVRAALRAQTWSPPTIADILAIIADPARRAVTTEAQLTEVLLDAIDDLHDEIRADPDIRQLFWHRQLGNTLRFIPLSETEFTTRMVGRLRSRLKRVVLRQEVQLRHRLGDDPGTFPDIEAIVQLAAGGEVVLLGEVKGNWHADVGTALEDQLVNRYLQGGRSVTGIYIVAWYASEFWDPDHYQRSDAARHTYEGLRATLEAAAARLSGPERTVHVRMIDLTLNSATS